VKRFGDDAARGRRAAPGGGLNRRDFLRLSGLGVAGVAVMGAAGTAFGQTATPTSAHDLGILPNDPARQTSNRDNLVSALTDSARSVVFPPGDYYIDNSVRNASTPLVSILIRNFVGELTMEQGARLLFTVKDARGLEFVGGTGARFRGLTTSFVPPLPSTRVNSRECILFSQTTDTVVTNADITGSAAAGLLFGRCVRPSVDGAWISSTMADGLHFANCNDPVAANVSTSDTGDDGLAFVNYGDATRSGGSASNVDVRGSSARGITVVGQSGVVVDGFAVETTDGAGLYCAYESSYGTGVPSNVRFANGTVTDAGKLAGDAPNEDGIHCSNVGMGVVFEDVDVYTPKRHGVAAIRFKGAPADSLHEVRFANVTVHDAPYSGFSLRNEFDSGQPQVGKYDLDRLLVREAGRTGFFVEGAALVAYTTLRSYNAHKVAEGSPDLSRAFSFEKNVRVDGTELYVEDDQAPPAGPTGYVVNASGATAAGDAQAGTLGTIYDRVVYGDVAVTNSSNLPYKLDATPPTAAAPKESLPPVGSTLGTSTVPVKLAWSGADEAGGSGVARYDLEQSVNGGAYSAVALPSSTSTSTTMDLALNATYQFRVRATDGAGNVGQWAEGASFYPKLHQETSANIAYSGVWTLLALADNLGGQTKYATAKGATATIRFTGKDVVWVAAKNTNRGYAEVWVDGAKVATVDQYAASYQPRQVVFRKSWSAVGARTLEVRVLGTRRAAATSNRIDLDGFVNVY
jgi:hypothetical protein